MKRTGYQLWQMIVLILLAAAMVVSLAAPESLLTPPAPRRVEISILMRQSGTSAWSVVRQGMEQAAEDLNAELRFLALEEENNGEEQIQLLRSQAQMDVDAAVVVPADCQGLDELLSQWKELPVITLESPLENAQAFVGPSNEEVGTLLAGQVIEDCSPGKKFLLVESHPGCQGPSRRLESTREALEQAGFAPEVCSEITASQMEQADGVICFEPATLERAAVLASQMEDPPLVYGAGVSDRSVAQLEVGGIKALAAWSDYASGYLAVTQAVAAARDQSAEDKILPVTLVQEGETYDQNHEKLLYPVFQ